MTTTETMIVVVSRAKSEATNLKGLIEFMDAPRVCTATPARWRDQVGEGRLEAVFVGFDLRDDEVRSLLDDVCEMDPNIPIVMLRENVVE